MLELNKIYNENCLETMSKMPDNFWDCSITSPPYSNIRDYNGYNFEFEKIAKELYRTCKEGGILCWVINDKYENGGRNLDSFKQGIYFKEQCGFTIHDVMIYEKSGFANPARNRYHQIYEFIILASKNRIKTFNPIKDKPNKIQYDFGKQRRQKDGQMSHVGEKERIKLNEFGMRFNIWRYTTGKGNSTRDEIAYKHPAIFPEKLAQDLIISFSNENDIIYDPMMGSGTVAKMAKLLNRNYIGSEISQEYCGFAEKRLNEYQRKI